MLTPPDIDDNSIIAGLRDGFGLRISEVSFLPIGAEVNTFVYRVTSDDGTPLFLKLRRGAFRDIVAAVPAFLHAKGIRRVMAPLPTADGSLWMLGAGFAWILYPFFEGKNGYEALLSREQWVALGSTIRAVHSATLAAEQIDLVPREDYSPRWRDVVRAHLRRAEQGGYDDPISVRLAALWTAKRDEVLSIVERAERLAEPLRLAQPQLVICHADLHGANVLVGADGALTVVDWDEVMLAPKERDLMSVGGGLFGRSNPDEEVTWFYEGYGPTVVDPTALAYYRYERIAADFAAYAEEIFGHRSGEDDRANGLCQLAGQFEPGQVIDLAHRTYALLS